jgi:hypothetical protein
MVENQFDFKVNIIRSDSGLEFKLESFYANKCIIHQTSCINISQQNGVAERKYRHLLNMARALLFRPVFLINFGVMLFLLPFTSSISHQPPFSTERHHMKNYLT